MEDKTFAFPVKQDKKSKKPYLFIGLCICVIVLLGVFIARQPKKSDELQNAITVTKEPLPTERPQIEKTSVKIQVLNGTGTPGQAALVVKTLTDEGYLESNIKSANAEEFDNPVTTITTRAGFEDIAADIEKILKTKFDKISIGSELDKDSEFDVVVLTGGKIEATSSPKTSITPDEDKTPTPTLNPSPTTTPTPSPTP